MFRFRDGPSSVNLALDAFAVLVFTLLMTLFWVFIASEEVRSAVKRKSTALPVLRRELDKTKSLRDGVMLLDSQITKLEKDARPNASAERESRGYYNYQILMRWVVPVVAAFAGIWLGLLTHNLVMSKRGQPRSFDLGHWCGTGFVFLSYVPEVLFFLFVIERYIVAGDYDLIRTACGMPR